jgi:hypothetical protein
MPEFDVRTSAGLHVYCGNKTPNCGVLFISRLAMQREAELTPEQTLSIDAGYAIPLVYFLGSHN